MSAYFPIKMDREAIFIAPQGDTSTISFEQGTVINGKTYSVEKDCDVFMNGYCAEFIQSFYRIEEGVIYLLKNRNDTIEYVFLPSKIKKGQKWKCFGDWTEIQVISLNATLKINNTDYSNLLRMRINDLSHEDRGKYDYYYKKNVGLIAETKNGHLLRYRIN